MRRFALLAAVLALAGVAAGCGGDDETGEDATAAWASDFCSAITGWTDDLESVQSEFTDTSNFSAEGLQSAAQDARSATEELVDELRSLGPPPTESGEEVEGALDDLSNTLDQTSAEIEQTAEGVSGLTELPSAISEITTSLSTLGTAFSNALTTIQNADVGGELERALEDSPECADISSS